MSNNTESNTLTPEQIDAWVASYEATGKLPSPKIPCSSGSGTLTTMFGERWKEPLKKWFEDNYDLPVKTIVSD